MDRKVVYWDANAFQGLLNNEPEDLALCQSAWAEAEAGNITIVTSTLTGAEVIYIKGTPKLDPAKRPRVANFFRQRFIIQRPVTRMIADLARDVVWDCGVKPKDAIHVATAAFDKIETFQTLDKDLLKKGSIVVAKFEVKISKPFGSGQTSLNLNV